MHSARHFTGLAKHFACSYIQWLPVWRVQTLKRSQHLLLALIWIGLFLLSATTAIASAGTTEILWDTYGVPHIYARNPEQLFYAFGWAQAQSHGNSLLRLYGQARGQAAAYWGEAELASDRWVRAMNIPNRAQEWYAAQTPQV